MLWTVHEGEAAVPAVEMLPSKRPYLGDIAARFVALVTHLSGPVWWL